MRPRAPLSAWGALVGRRAVLLTLVAAAVLVACLAPDAVATAAERSARQEAGATAAALDAARRGVRITTVRADDPDAQREAADRVLASLPEGVEATSTLMSSALQARTAGGAARPVLVAHVADWAERVDLVDGRAPSAPDEVAAPARSGLTAGQQLLIGGAQLPVEVVGTWEPRDESDPLWFADPGLATGTLSDRRGAAGPLFAADDAGVERVSDSPLVRWTVVPDAATLTGDDLAEVARGLAALPEALAQEGVLVQGAAVEGEGGTALATIADEARVSEGLTRAATALALGAAALGLLAAAAAYEAATRPERDRLLVRGARRARLVGREAPAVLLAVLVAGIVGAIAAGGALAGLRVYAAAVGAAATLVALLRRLPVDARSSRVRVAALVALLVVGTAFAMWRLIRASGRPEGVALAAPLLLLVCAGGLVAWVARRIVRRPSVSAPAAALPVPAALLGGAFAYALLAQTTIARTAWVAATAAALLALALVVAAAVVARRGAGRARPALRRWPAVATSLVAGLAGGAVAVATAGLALGIAA